MSISLPSRFKPVRRESTAVPRSQLERLWQIGGTVAAFVLVLIGYFFFVGPQRSKTADVRSQVTAAAQHITDLQNRIAALRQQNANLPKYESDLAQARLALPATSGVSDFVRTLQTLGSATLTNVTSVTVGPPAPLAATAATTPTTGAAAGGSSAGTGSAAGSSAGTGTAGTGTGGAAAGGTGVAPTVAPPAPSIYSLSITATVSGPDAALDQFLQQLQSVQPRAVLISTISESVGSGTANAKGTSTLQLTMQAFIAPADQSASSVGSAGSAVAAVPGK